MVDFGDILDAWESSSENVKKKQSGNIREKSATVKDAKVESMQTEWLDLYPPEDKDRINSDQSQGDSNRRKMNPDKLLIQARIDLHGLNSKEAETAVESFLRDSARKGYRKVLIIHGKGYHSPGGMSVLKKVIRQLLERSPLVSQFGQGDRMNGGRGASWVLLINQKQK